MGIRIVGVAAGAIVAGHWGAVPVGFRMAALDNRNLWAPRCAALAVGTVPGLAVVNHRAIGHAMAIGTRPAGALDTPDRQSIDSMENMDSSLCAGASTPDASGAAKAEPRKPSRMKRRNFYIVGRNHQQRKPKGVELVNGPDLFRGTGYRTLAPPDAKIRGFRDYPVRPRFRISTRLGRKLNDIEFDGAYWLVSDRAKQVLGDISKTDFAFLPIETEVDEGQARAVYWLCNVVQVLDAVDDSRSQVKAGIADNGERDHSIIGIFSLIFDEAIVGSHHAFRLWTSFPHIVCDETFKAAIKQSGLTGLSYRDAARP